MPLSSNTLLHLTKEKSALLGILEESFKVFFCRETFEMNNQTLTARIPMVSFCDIPLSEVKNHIESYGHYGIGLTKAWATRQRLNPVLYLEPNSLLATSVNGALQKLIADDASESLSEAQYDLADMIRYIKNYEGVLNRKDGTRRIYRFSDEREWRYVPPRSDYPALLETDETYAADPPKADAALSSLRLTFEPEDIKYIIIRDDSEISEFLHHLRTAKGRKYSHYEIERLTTRLLTTEQILGDV